MMTRDEIHTELKNLSRAAEAKYHSHAYAAGYLESLVATLLIRLPANERDVVIDSVRRTTEMLVSTTDK